MRGRGRTANRCSLEDGASVKHAKAPRESLQSGGHVRLGNGFEAPYRRCVFKCGRSRKAFLQSNTRRDFENRTICFSTSSPSPSAAFFRRFVLSSEKALLQMQSRGPEKAQGLSTSLRILGNPWLVQR